jgi:hypothetical protein
VKVNGIILKIKDELQSSSKEFYIFVEMLKNITENLQFSSLC